MLPVFLTINILILRSFNRAASVIRDSLASWHCCLSSKLDRICLHLEIHIELKQSLLTEKQVGQQQLRRNYCRKNGANSINRIIINKTDSNTELTATVDVSINIIILFLLLLVLSKCCCYSCGCIVVTVVVVLVSNCS